MCPAPAIVTATVQSGPFDVAEEMAALQLADGEIGGVVSFTGLCRNDGGDLTALELEHYPAMAEQQLQQIAQQAAEKWAVSRLRLVHRFGMIRPGEPIVLVIAASAHRADAFHAAEFVMDFLKTDAPFWKKEHRENAASSWVEAHAADDEAKARWQSR